MAKKVLVALSGGVDSSTAAYLLKQQKLDVSAVYIKFYASNKKQAQIIDQESQVAKKIAEALKIPFVMLDFAQEQKEWVIDDLLNSYQHGLTPNPCIVCNKLLKFGRLLDWAKEQGFSHLATGHYAQIIQKNHELYLAAAKDKSKDQSYFLYQLNEAQLKQLIFPLGLLTKTAVREIAQKAKLNHLKRESFDICFLRDSNLRQFLANNIQENPGEIVDQNGLVIGQHRGLAFYTIGQRHGFVIDHQALKKSQTINYDKNRAPALLVVNKIPEKNRLVVAEKAASLVNKFTIKELHFINNSQQQLWQEKASFYALVKIRNQGKLIPCQVKINGNQLLVKTQDKIFAPASGQSAVFYRDTRTNLLVIAGALIGNGVGEASNSD